MSDSAIAPRARTTPRSPICVPPTQARSPGALAEPRRSADRAGQRPTDDRRRRPSGPRRTRGGLAADRDEQPHRPAGPAARRTADPGVDGVLATADILDDLLLLGALEDKVVFSSMNRGGLAGAQFELDDRMTGGHRGCDRRGQDEWRKDAVPHRSRRSGYGRHLEACARAIDELAVTRPDRDARAVHVDAGSTARCATT